MTLDEYSLYDAVGLSALVRRREISPPELAQAALAAIAAVNPRINTVVETFPKRAASATGSGPLSGFSNWFLDQRYGRAYGRDRILLCGRFIN